ncbi:hypothetical protein Patl_4139 [Paraglaciecola sp. T6c]|uniref:DUF748 domain-containing protein n=1 Tax=Pseudoalteromonas atlantica (strain T6c / ATCC BAA-1087) TaxID=3042615 RepID=UPI00005C6FF5|nr:DUF748 domain-containing protein [Paraglaciecola sp. T6c]ABG42638.1 hypothetical protein Patl_4139 [Paraglaciecola sp. T6c]
MAHRRRKTAITLISLAVILVALRLVAPYAVQKGVNYAIRTTPGLSGQVGDVDIALYRGAYQVENIELNLVDGDLQKPLISIQQLDISVLWSALLRGNIVSEMTFLKPQFYYADDVQQEEKINQDVQNEQTWITLANRLVPFSIDRIDIIDGRLMFETISAKRKTLTEITDVHGQITNLTNSKQRSGSLVTHLALDAEIAGVCPLAVSGSYDPYAAKPTFNVDVEMQRLPVKHIDHLISFYSPFDLEAGQIDFAMEFASKQGDVSGYVKAGVYDLSVFDWQEDVVKDGDNPFQWLFEAATGGIAELFEGGKKDLIATRVPLEGKIDDIQTPLWPAIGAIIKNAFIKSLDIKVDKVVSLPASTTQKDIPKRLFAYTTT